MKALLDFVKSPAGRKVLVLVVASALAAGASALGLPADVIKELCAE